VGGEEDISGLHKEGERKRGHKIGRPLKKEKGRRKDGKARYVMNTSGFKLPTGT